MNDEYDFKRAYDHVAQSLINAGPVKTNPLPLCLVLVTLAGDQVFSDAIPVPSQMLSGDEGHAVFNDTVNVLLRKMALAGDRCCCVVIVAEAITLATKHRLGDPLPEPTPALKDHPDARPAIVVRVLRPEGQRLGMLLLGPDRSLSYQEPVEPLPKSAPPDASLH